LGSQLFEILPFAVRKERTECLGLSCLEGAPAIRIISNGSLTSEDLEVGVCWRTLSSEGFSVDQRPLTPSKGFLRALSCTALRRCDLAAHVRKEVCLYSGRLERTKASAVYSVAGAGGSQMLAVHKGRRF
jgi:hypothetical protein